MSVNPLNLLENKPTRAKHSICVEDDFFLHYRHDLPGELEAPKGLTYHLITFFLTKNQRQITHFEHHGEYDGQMARGEFYLCPVGVSGFTCWQADETLHFIIKPNLLRKVAIETECLNPDRIELLPMLKTRDLKIEQLAQLFLAEMTGDRFGKRLYLESLSEVLAVHLLRNYCVFEPLFPKYTNGLTPDKLRQTIDYIQAYLDTDLSLEVMAKQIGMSRCYFASQFKQAMGISPHQYVNQQRIKKAQQLLRQERSLVEIALDCGFASQSHFNKVFRQYVGMTPKNYQQQL
jgi:AraC family transcriptional regulator